MDDKARKELERAYELRLMKSATKRRPAAAAASSSNAAEALKGIASIQRRESRAKREAGKSSSQPATFVAPVRKKPVAKTADESRERSGFMPGPRGLVVGGAAIVGLACLGGLAVVLSPPAGGRHSVSGTVLLDNRPLGNAKLYFHSRDRWAEPIRVITTPGGNFHAEDIPAGEYCVSVTAAAGGVEVPNQYRSQESTPFRIQLRRDRANVRMVASSRTAR